jgi:hypothetical protein
MSHLAMGKSVRVHALHWVARVALRRSQLLRAKAIVDRCALFCGRLHDVDEVRTAVRTLVPSGSCLSRALTIAAMAPEAQIVIGVDAWSSARLSAHAWLEIDGLAVDTVVESHAELPVELARLPHARSVRRHEFVDSSNSASQKVLHSAE